MSVNPSVSDNQVLRQIISNMEEVDQKYLLEVFLENPNLISKIPLLVQRKQTLLNSGDSDDWEKLIEEEEKDILKFL